MNCACIRSCDVSVWVRRGAVSRPCGSRLCVFSAYSFEGDVPAAGSRVSLRRPGRNKKIYM